MNKIDIKDIKKAALEDYQKQTKYNNGFDRQKGFIEGAKWAEKQVKNLIILDVSQQSELLLFRQWQERNWANVYLYSDEFMISEYLKSNNG